MPVWDEQGNQVTEWDEQGNPIGGPPAKRDPADIFKGQLGRMGSFGAAPTQEDIQAGRDANIPALTLAAMAGPAMAANPMVALKGLGMSLAGGAAGGYTGRAVGGGLEAAGAPSGTSKVLGTAGGLAGGFAGPMVGPKALLSLAESTGMKGTLLPILRKMFPEAVASGVEGAAAKPLSEGASKVAAEKLALETRKLAAREKALEIAAERNALLRMRLEGKAPLATPRPKAPVAEPAASPVVEGAAVAQPAPAVEASTVAAPGTSEIVLKLQQQMGTSSGRKVVREILAQMPKAEADQIKVLLAKGQEHPATVLGALFDPTKSAFGKAARPGEELARLLGQIP